MYKYLAVGNEIIVYCKNGVCGIEENLLIRGQIFA